MKNRTSLIISGLVGIMLAIPAWAEEHNTSTAVDSNGGDFYFNPHRIIVGMNLPEGVTLCKEVWTAPPSLVVMAPEAGMDSNVSQGYRQNVVSLDPATTDPCLIDCSIDDHRKPALKGLLKTVE